MPGVWWLGGHLGAAVSALVDGQLDEESAERAWQHVAGCASCRGLVEREGWVKRRLAEMAAAAPTTPEPPSDLLGSLYDLRPVAEDRYAAHAAAHAAAQASWAAVERLEQRNRSRRRAGLAVAGVGSVSAAVLGLGALGAAPLGIGGAPGQAPTSALTRATPTGTPAPASVSGSVSGPAGASASPAPSASATPGATTSATATPGPGVPTTGPFGGWQLRSGAGAVNRAAPVRSLP